MEQKVEPKDVQIEKMGELGTNIPVDVVEKEEDLLETLYSDWREGKSMLLYEAQERVGMKTREMNLLVRRLVRHGYLAEPDKNHMLTLTELGKMRGAECVSRHRVLTQFIQMVSGQSSEKSEAEACRLEHVVSDETVGGLDEFLRNGDTYDRVFSNTDLCNIASYEEGEYALRMGLYYPGRVCPRILVRGFDEYKIDVRLVVKDGSSEIHLRRYNENLPETLWYLKNGQWERAAFDGETWVLPTQLFELEKGADLPIIEAKLTVALPDEGLTPIVLDCMDLNVHIW